MLSSVVDDDDDDDDENAVVSLRQPHDGTEDELDEVANEEECTRVAQQLSLAWNINNDTAAGEQTVGPMDLFNNVDVDLALPTSPTRTTRHAQVR